MMAPVTRRQLLAAAGPLGLGVAVTGCGRLRWPGGSATAPTPPVRRLGLLSSPGSPYEADFRQALRDIGYVEGQNLALEARYEQTRAAEFDEFADLAGELVRLPVDALATIGIRATYGARAATTTLPIMQVWGVGDLVGTPLVESFARPGGNVTGLTSITTELVGKWLQLLKVAVPAASRIAVLTFIPAGRPQYVSLEAEAHVAAQALGIEATVLPATYDRDLDRALESFAGGGFDGLVLSAGVVVIRRAQEILNLIRDQRLPAIADARWFAVRGGLMAYLGSTVDNARRGAAMVDKVLRGVSPAEIPIERPMLFDFVVNMKTAAALGLTFPPEILLQVTEAIE
jgi:putative ABC transport system substrate-binding protein